MNEIHSSQNLLNEKFFKDMDTILIERMRAKMKDDEKSQALGDAMGIEDQDVLHELVEKHVGPETISAFRLVPLVAVAWSDGQIQPQEHDAILKAASENGIKPGTDAYEMLQSWLQRKPAADLVDAWKHYTQQLIAKLSPAAVDTLRNEVIHRAESIAAAAGGILGLGSISASENAVIEDLKSVFP